MSIGNLSHSARERLHSEFQKFLDTSPKEQIELHKRIFDSMPKPPFYQPPEELKVDPNSIDVRTITWIKDHSRAIAGTAVAIIVAVGAAYAATYRN